MAFIVPDQLNFSFHVILPYTQGLIQSLIFIATLNDWNVQKNSLLHIHQLIATVSELA